MIEKSKIMGVVLVIFLLISIGFNIYLYKFSLKDDTEFFKDYVIAMNDYHIANSYFNLGSTNLDNGDFYIEGDYYYEFAIDYFDVAKEQFTDAKQLLIHSKAKLENIERGVPNDFYKEEIQNRKEQNEIMLSLINQYFLLADYTSKQIYEINYGSETEATRYFNLYNDLIIEINKNLQKISDISQKIDLVWDQDWYVLLEGA